MKATVSGTWKLFANAGGLWLERNAFLHAGSLAFYTLFSLAPIVIIAVAVAGIIFGEDAARGQIVTQIQDVLGREGALAVQDAVARSRVEAAGLVPTIAGVTALVVGATTVFAQMQLSLNSIWGVVAKPRRSSLLILLKTRVLSLAIVLTIGFLLLVSLLLNVALKAVIHYADTWIPLHGAVLTSAEFVLSLVVVTLLFAVIFKVLPDVRVAWPDVWAGAAITALMFIAGRHLIALYLAYSAPASTYGAAGSLVLVLLWVYYSSLILFFGAALTKEKTLASGKTVVPRAMAVRVKREVVEEAG
jgi:membrane protein